ncbi:MAG: hypothetical protein PHP42_07345 [Bacteroidota bacterium]|nr:hypothetical protein [Bacteroidota bacterium]
MGQQQLLLIILGVIIIGIAVGVAVVMFNDNSVSSNKEAMSTDLLHIAAKARHYYGRPSSMGGGSHSFAGLTMDKMVNASFANNANGYYEIISVAPDAVVIQGTGKVTKPNGDSVKVQLTVTPSGPGNIITLP